MTKALLRALFAGPVCLATLPLEGFLTYSIGYPRPEDDRTFILLERLASY
jgi:hypothetical protein